MDSNSSEDHHIDGLTPEIIRHFLSTTNETMNDYICHLTDSVSGNKLSGGCNASFDGLLCWPSTPPESLAVLSCMSEINGIQYNTTQNATRWCHSNSTWDLSDYSACQEVAHSGHPPEPEVVLTTTIYFIGYSLSLIVLGIAIWIFFYFKDLRCLRNIIHMNLMLTYLLTDLAWILTLYIQTGVHSGMITCICLIVSLHYFHLTNFFWMFVEGLYLYMLVVATFTGENIKLRVYATIGWGSPVIFVVIWVITKLFAHDDDDVQSNASLILKDCPWMVPHNYDWIYKAPAVFILLVNFVFLIVIMWVLIIKLRSAQSVETQQYRKAMKALLVLIPLLGITYIVTIAGPNTGWFKPYYDNFRAILLSTQGMTVALFYCFWNTEVQNTIKHHFERWKTERSFHGSRRYNYSTHSKDWSPRSRTESIRLYSQPTNIYKKRESTASETTTTTLVNVNGGGRVSNGSQMRSPLLQPPGLGGGGLSDV